MRKIVGVAVLAMAVAGCGLDKLAKPDAPSEFQQHMERVALVTQPVAPAEVEPEVEGPAPEPMPVTSPPPPEPPCEPVTRVWDCVDGKRVEANWP